MQQNITLYKVNDILDFATKFLYKLYEKKHRVIFLHDNEEFLNKLDEVLWMFKQISFIPHVKENHPLASKTPIVLSQFPFKNINEADTLVMINTNEIVDFPNLVKGFSDAALYEQEKQKHQNATCWVQKNDTWTKEQ